MPTSIELTQMLIAKFCHDLAGTMGAIDNAVEFLKVNNELTRNKAEDLIASGSRQSISTLKFFREAYGISKNRGEANLDEIRELAEAFLQDNSKITLDFQQKYCHLPEIFICLATGKLILCVVAIAAANLPRGGSIKVEVEKGPSGKKLMISSIGSGLKMNEDHHGILRSETKDLQLSTLNVHYYYTKQLVEQLGARLTVSISSDEIGYIIE